MTSASPTARRFRGVRPVNGSTAIRRLRAAALASLLAVASGPAVHAEDAARPAYAVVVVLDGFRDDYIDRFNAPTLRALAEQGVRFTRAAGVFPGNSTVNQTSLVTGAYPRTTGIPNNSRYDRAADRIVTPLRDNRAVTVTEVFRSAGLRTASVGHYMLEGRVDLYSKDINIGRIWLQSPSPPHLFVYLNTDVDAAGHAAGPFGAVTAQAVEEADRQVRGIIEALQRRGVYEQTVIVVVSDHGMSPTGGKPVSPPLAYQLWAHGFTFARRDDEITADTDIVYIQHGSAFLYLREGRFDADREQRLVEALRRIEGAEVLTRDDLIALHTDPDLVGDVVLVPQEGYTLYPGSGSTGIHGRPSERYITLIMAGPGVRKGVTPENAEIVDVVPTLLALFGLPVPPTVDGRVLYEALTLEAPDGAAAGA